MSPKETTIPKRHYRKRRRAEQEDETRRRITEATVDLHGTVGPARTTVSAVADRAGVQRATVYRHFPDEESLFQACSSHWIAANPVPDLTGWEEVEGPDRRLVVALGELYAWFERSEYMLEKTTRDSAAVPALQPSMAAFAQWVDAATGVLLRGRPQRGAPRRRIGAAIGHALAFSTWRSLVREQGLSAGDAIDLMTGMVDAAAGDG